MIEDSKVSFLRPLQPSAKDGYFAFTGSSHPFGDFRDVFAIRSTNIALVMSLDLALAEFEV